MNNDSDNLVALSRIAFIQGKYEESLKLAKQALANDSKSSDAHQCAGNAYMFQEDYNSAIVYNFKVDEYHTYCLC